MEWNNFFTWGIIGIAAFIFIPLLSGFLFDVNSILPNSLEFFGLKSTWDNIQSSVNAITKEINQFFETIWNDLGFLNQIFE